MYNYANDNVLLTSKTNCHHYSFYNNLSLKEHSVDPFFSRKCFRKEHIICYVIYFFSLDNFKTTSVADNDNAIYKQCNSAQTKSNKSDSLMHAIIGLAIMALLIIFIYLYTYQLKNYQKRRATV